MTITIYSNENQMTPPKFARAFQKGAGGVLEFGDADPVGAWAGFGDPSSWRSLAHAIRTGMDWYYGDHSYFHHGRKIYYRITKNAFQHRGVGKPDYARLSPFFTRAEKFKKHGRYILICLQSENYHARMGSPLPQYLDNLVARIRLYSDREIVVRTKQSETKFHHDLTGAWAVVAHSSATAIEALMHGVPAFTTSDNAAGLLTLRDPINIERPYFPSMDERMHMAAVLARQQWTLEEIENGLAWRTLHEAF